MEKKTLDPFNSKDDNHFQRYLLCAGVFNMHHLKTKSSVSEVYKNGYAFLDLSFVKHNYPFCDISQLHFLSSQLRAQWVVSDSVSMLPFASIITTDSSYIPHSDLDHI